jgi:hypothetical protein
LVSESRLLLRIHELCYSEYYSLNFIIFFCYIFFFFFFFCYIYIIYMQGNNGAFLYSLSTIDTRSRLENCRISLCNSKGRGGALFLSTDPLVSLFFFFSIFFYFFLELFFFNYFATLILFVSNFFDQTIIDCSFRGNTAEESGVDIYCEFSEFDPTFIINSCSSSSGNMKLCVSGKDFSSLLPTCIAYATKYVSSAGSFLLFYFFLSCVLLL